MEESLVGQCLNAVSTAWYSQSNVDVLASALSTSNGNGLVVVVGGPLSYTAASYQSVMDLVYPLFSHLSFIQDFLSTAVEQMEPTGLDLRHCRLISFDVDEMKVLVLLRLWWLPASESRRESWLFGYYAVAEFRDGEVKDRRLHLSMRVFRPMSPSAASTAADSETEEGEEELETKEGEGESQIEEGEGESDRLLRKRKGNGNQGEGPDSEVKGQKAGDEWIFV